MVQKADGEEQLASDRKRALITGITGQDGSYLAELLLSKGYQVHGITRSNHPYLGCSSHLGDQLTVHRVGSDAQQWSQVLAELQPDELYHFAADSFIPHGWENPLENLHANLGLALSLLEAIRKLSPHTRMLNACSREVYGNSGSQQPNESTPMQPVTPYGINKAASRWTVESYRQRYGVFAANAILFNHESPRRGTQFVTRKITKRVAEIRMGLAQDLELGDLQVRRDWGYAGDYVDAMWSMLQLDRGEDFVIGTGRTHSIQEFASRAFQCVGLDWQEYVQSVARLERANDTVGMAADISKATRLLNWYPQVSFDQLISMMVDADMLSCDRSDTPTRRAA